jgi:hypothetical protein
MSLSYFLPIFLDLYDRFLSGQTIYRLSVTISRGKITGDKKIDGRSMRVEKSLRHSVCGRSVSSQFCNTTLVIFYEDDMYVVFPSQLILIFFGPKQAGLSLVKSRRPRAFWVEEKVQLSVPVQSRSPRASSYQVLGN